MNWSAQVLVYLACSISAIAWYIFSNDRRLSVLPERALKYSPTRYTASEVQDTYQRLCENPYDVVKVLPPRTGRRYIVIGGAGFLGGWIVVHLLLRGEDPRRIRVLDIRPPTRIDLTTGKAADVDFRVVDVSDKDAVDAAFTAPWPREDETAVPELTIIHTAANIRFYERVPWLVHLSSKVNVNGTQNVINAARAAGATVMIYTSSGSVSIWRSHFLLWPWQKEPKHFVQLIEDNDALTPKRQQHFFSNYAYTKRVAEALVRSADKSPSDDKTRILRTGCLRPGNGIFGPGGDVLCGAYLVRGTNPSWIPNTLQNFVYVENCSLAHLCYEQRLIELSYSSKNPDIGGQAYCIADPGPPVTYGDTYQALNYLSHGKTIFPLLSPTAMLLLAYIFEAWYLFKQYLISLPAPLNILGSLLPGLGGDLVNLQPSLFALVNVHLIFFDHRARLPPNQGGLGYQGLWTTLEGLCKTYEEHVKADGHVEERQKNGGGISFGFGLVRAQRGLEDVAEELGISKPNEHD